MAAFWLGVLASVVAAYIVFILSRYLPSGVRTLIAVAIGSALGLGINRVYKDEDRASSDILRDAAKSKTIRILSIRGFRLTSEGRPLSRLLGKDFGYDRLEVMLADPQSPAVLKRSQGFTDTTLVYPKAEMYADDVAKSVNVLIGSAMSNTRIRVRTHNQCESFRLLLTDDSLYLSFYPKGRSASTSPVCRIERGSILFDAFVAHYEWIRQYNSREQRTAVRVISQEGVKVNYHTIVQPAEAAKNLENPDWLFVDCRFVLGKPEFGASAYVSDHIPGASYVDLETDLSDLVEIGKTGRHPLPKKGDLLELISRLGIDSTTQVVAYDESSGAMAAARLWWLLQWAGHENVAVLDGGLSAWRSGGLETNNKLPPPRSKTIPNVRFRDNLLTDASQLSIKDSKRILVDSRAADRFRGENETIDPVAGHIPGAYSLPFIGNLTDNGKFRSPEQLRDRFSNLVENSSTNDVVFYCGSGVTAAHNILAFASAYSELPKLYAGSWSEWITDSTRAVATGEQQVEN